MNVGDVIELVIGFVILLGLLGGAMAVHRRRILRLYRVVHLFEPDRIVENFRSMDSIFPSAAVHHGDMVHELERVEATLPDCYEYQGETRPVAGFLDQTWTTGLVVLVDGRIAYEDYERGNTESSRVISWSVAKSFVSALVGIAISEGHISDVDRPISDYVPVLKGSGYEGVAILDVLQMSSGVRFSETYGRFFSDINRLGRALALDRPLDRFVTRLRREREPGTYRHYMSMDTQALGMLVREATGETLSSYLESRIWKKIGMESDGTWLVDGGGTEIAFGGLNAVLRDYARFGQLYLDLGRSWRGEQIVPRRWVEASVTADAPHLRPGPNPASDWVLGYGYQWWIPEEPDGDYLAIGVYNQFIYVYPRYHVVIAKSSAYPDYTKDGSEKELETIALFRAIARHMAPFGSDVISA